MEIYTKHPYTLVVTMAPAQYSYGCYGIKNVVTGVVEAYVAQLARAKYFVDLYARELKEGVQAANERVGELLSALRGYDEEDDGGPTDGGAQFN